MNVISRGIRNAFRNQIRTLSVVLILGLSMGLSLSMLIAHNAVGDKINSVKASVGNTVTIAPAGFSGFSSVNNSLTTSQLSKVAGLAHVASVSETLTDRLSAAGASQTSSGGFGGQLNTNSNATTNLTSPVTLNTSDNNGSGHNFFVAGGGSLPTNFSLPITITGTNTPSSLNDATIMLKSGKMIDGSKADNDALVSSSMAAKNNLKVGSTFTAYAKTLTVSGIFSSSSTNATRSSDDTIIVSLPTEQTLSGQSGDVTSAVATIDSVDNLDSATTAIKNSLGSSADVTSSVEEANNSVQPLNSVKTISLYSVIGAVAAGSVIVLLTMVMIVRERRREIGIFKALGASNFKVMLQFMSEAVSLTLLGAVVGIVIGIAAGNPITKLLVNNSSSSSSTTSGMGGGLVRGGGNFRTGGRGFGLIHNSVTNVHAEIGWNIIIYGLLAALVIALVGSAAVSLLISKVRPAEVMRSE
jgi:putative ABC transport system permease protein